MGDRLGSPLGAAGFLVVPTAAALFALLMKWTLNRTPAVQQDNLQEALEVLERDVKSLFRHIFATPQTMSLYRDRAARVDCTRTGSLL